MYHGKFHPSRWWKTIVVPSVVHPDPDGSETICKLGSGSVINSGSDSGFESGSKLSSVSNQQIQSCENVQILKKLAFFQCLDDLQFKWIFLNNPALLRCLDDLNFLCIFHKQAGSGFESGTKSGSKIKVKVRSGSRKNSFGSTTLVVP